MLIGITGAKGSGKDTFARPFLEQGALNLKMAGPLKAMLHAMCLTAEVDPQEIEWMLEGDLKEIPCEVFGGKTPRHAMQTLGTEWRNMLHQDLWLNIWKRRVRLCLERGAEVVCTDIRFIHEAVALRDLGGVLVRIDRPGSLTGDVHVSETEMLSLTADYLITNDRGIPALHQKARDLRKELFA